MNTEEISEKISKYNSLLIELQKLGREIHKDTENLLKEHNYDKLINFHTYDEDGFDESSDDYTDYDEDNDSVDMDYEDNEDYSEDCPYIEYYDKHDYHHSGYAVSAKYDTTYNYLTVYDENDYEISMYALDNGCIEVCGAIIDAIKDKLK